jgi:hypothetical protein
LVLEKYGRGGLDSCGSEYGPVAACCEHGNEPSDSIKGRKFLDYLSVLSASQEGLCYMAFVPHCTPSNPFFPSSDDGAWATRPVYKIRPKSTDGFSTGLVLWYVWRRIETERVFLDTRQDSLDGG